MDDNLPFDVEEILGKEVNNAATVKLVENTAAVESDSFKEQGTMEVGSFRWFSNRV